MRTGDASVVADFPSVVADFPPIVADFPPVVADIPSVVADFPSVVAVIVVADIAVRLVVSFGLIRSFLLVSRLGPTDVDGTVLSPDEVAVSVVTTVCSITAVVVMEFPFSFDVGVVSECAWFVAEDSGSVFPCSRLICLCT